MTVLKVSNDNHAPYWSQPVLDRAREMTARLEARKRRAARFTQMRGCPGAPDRPAAKPRNLRRDAARTWRLWDDLGLPAQYGLTVVGALGFVVAAMELLSLTTAGS